MPVNSPKPFRNQFGTATAAFLVTVGLLHGQAVNAAKKNQQTGQQVFPDHCSDGRSLPFAAIEVQHPVDTACYWTNGKQTSPAATKLQNSVKNNFCIATPLAQAETYTPQKLIALQDSTQIATGQGKEPAARSGTQALGEGKLIRIAAFIIEAHFADVGTGESVNCGLTIEEGNDIHMALGPTATTAECGSVTAEISPHYRPATWAQIGNFQTYNTATKKYSVNAAYPSRRAQSVGSCADCKPSSPGRRGCSFRR